MTAFEICTLVLTSIGMLLGGGWALIEKQSSLKDKIESQKIESVEEMVVRIEKSVEKLSDKIERICERLEKLEGRLGIQFEKISEKLHILRETLEGVSSETKNVKVNIADSARLIAEGVRRITERSEVKDMGNGYVKVESKKNKPTEG